MRDDKRKRLEAKGWEDRERERGSLASRRRRIPTSSSSSGRLMRFASDVDASHKSTSPEPCDQASLVSPIRPPLRFVGPLIRSLLALGVSEHDLARNIARSTRAT